MSEQPDVTPAPKAKKPKRQSRASRWQEAAATALQAVEELKGIQEEFQEWYDNLNEGGQASATGQKLEAITGLDLDSAVDAIQEADGADVPLGYGRD